MLVFWIDDDSSLTSVFFAVLFACVVYILTFARHRPKHYPPGPPRLPIIGNLHQIGSKPFQTFMRMKKKYGDIIAIDFGGFRGVILNDYKVIREAFSMSEFSGRPHLEPFVARCGGDRLRGLGFSEGKQWLEQRKFVVKNLREFGFGKKSMETLIQIEVTELVNTLANLKGKPFTTQNLFNLAVVNSLWFIITGERFPHDDERLVRLVKLVTEGVSHSPAAGAFFFFPWLSKIAPDFSGYNSFVGFQLKIMDYVKEKYNQHKSTFDRNHLRDFLDLNIQQILNTSDPKSSFFKDEGEQNLLVTTLDLFGAGVETTSTVLSWIILYLSIHPSIQEDMHKQILDVVGESKLPSLNDRAQMPYVEAIILEVLRISAVAPFAVFHRTTEDVLFHSYKIPKDTLIVPNIYGAHRDASVWGDPDIFRPERFLAADETIIRHHNALMPFSTGKRVCIGETLAQDELFLFIASIFQRFRVEPNPKQPMPTMDYYSGFILIPKPYEFLFHDRHCDCDDSMNTAFIKD